jgi:hypothetical protein
MDDIAETNVMAEDYALDRGKTESQRSSQYLLLI